MLTKKLNKRIDKFNEFAFSFTDSPVTENAHRRDKLSCFKPQKYIDEEIKVLIF